MGKLQWLLICCCIAAVAAAPPTSGKNTHNGAVRRHTRRGAPRFKQVPEDGRQNVLGPASYLEDMSDTVPEDEPLPLMSRMQREMPSTASHDAAVEPVYGRIEHAPEDAVDEALSHNVALFSGVDMRHDAAKGFTTNTHSTDADPAIRSAVSNTANSLHLLHRVFAAVEAERVESRAAPCDPADTRNELTALLLACLCPPAAYFYYEYTVMGSIQLVLYVLSVAPLIFACGWYVHPFPKSANSFPTASLLGETVQHVNNQSRKLWFIACASGVAFLMLLCWQISLIVRIATHDFLPANGCEPSHQLHVNTASS